VGSRRAKPVHIDRRQEHSLKSCPRCGNENLSQRTKKRNRIIIDIPECFNVETVEHTIGRSWCPECKRIVKAKIEWYAGELFPKIGFIVTNLRWKSSNVVKFYNKRGPAEQWIKEGKYALNWTRLSCHDFVDNQVRLQLFALTYNLGNFLRRLALPNKIRDWSLRMLQVKLIKIGAKVVKHSRYVIFQMAEVIVSRSLFHEILERIGHLKPVPIGSG